MNIFISSDLVAEYFIVDKLTKLLSKYDLTKCTLLTTNRFYDKQFIDFALINGMEIKVYNLQQYLTDETLFRVAEQIDHLILFSDMSNFLYRKLFEICDSTVIVHGERQSFKKYSKQLHAEYDALVDSYYKDGRFTEIDSLEIFEGRYLTKLKEINRVPINVIT